MCCFTGPVLTVRRTRIFGRTLPEGRQLVVYETAFAAAADLAMVLPIPVRQPSGDDAIRFLDLVHLPAFFDRLDRAIGKDHVARFGALPGGGAYRAQPLAVHDVGMFEASFVPTRRDFGRLDPRFRLSDAVLDALDARGDHGFVVVQLARTARVTRVHPFAFTFSTRDVERVFFPTVHVHDNELHDTAEFDHALYTTEGARASTFACFGLEDGAAIPPEPTMSPELASAHDATWQSGEIDHTITDRTGSVLVDRGARVYRRDVARSRANDDTWIETKPPPSDPEVIAALERGAEDGRSLPAVKAALRTVRSERFSLLQTIRNAVAGVREVEIEAIRSADHGGGSVFWVHARNASLRGRSDRKDARAVLCALAPPRRRETAWYEAVVPLHSRQAVDDWIASGAVVTPAEAAWLREHAR